MNIQIPEYNKAKVLVVGDIMLDRYWFGSTDRISPEAPVPVVKYQYLDERAGGAANVAVNLSSLGVTTKIISIIGDDEAGLALEKLLADKNVSHTLIKTDKPTICKTRVMSQNQQLLRVDKEILPVCSVDVVTEFEKAITDFDVVVFSDYGKGALIDIKTMISICKSKEKTVLVDPKGKDFNDYRFADIITPNLSEFKQIMGDFSDEKELEEKAKKFIHELNIKSLLLTRSGDGMSLFTDGKHEKHSAKAKEVFDVTGAGDTVIATLAASIAAKSILSDAVELANVAAGVVVGKIGTYAIDVKSMYQALHANGNIMQGFMEENQLLVELEKARQNGEKIVMTNGCFDILHIGHVNYLNQAKQLGDRLLVAINTDESIARLKGANRPANKLQSRANVLASLRSVDWVVSFSEDDPVRIIDICNPDFLVKGGDNDPNTILGAKEVREKGGKVLVMDYVDGFSTTNTINRIVKNTER